MRFSLLTLLLLSLSLSGLAQETPAVRYHTQLSYFNMPFQVNDRGFFSSNIAGLEVYTGGRKVTTEWAVVDESGKVYGAELRDYLPAAGTYATQWTPTPRAHGGFTLNEQPKAGRYWYVIKEAGQIIFAEWFDLRPIPQVPTTTKFYSPFYTVPACHDKVCLYFGEDGKGDLQVTVGHLEREGQLFELVLKYDGKPVGWLPGFKGKEVKAGPYAGETVRMVYASKQLSDGTYLGATITRAQMIDGNWSLDVMYDKKVARSYSFTIKDWLMAPQGRQAESTPRARKIIDPWYWWLDATPETESPPEYKVPAWNGTSWG